MQMASICENWKIPYLNISGCKNPAEISSKLLEVEPKIILTSIEDISNFAVQTQLQSLTVSYIAIDECQVIKRLRSQSESCPGTFSEGTTNLKKYNYVSYFQGGRSTEWLV